MTSAEFINVLIYNDNIRDSGLIPGKQYYLDLKKSDGDPYNVVCLEFGYGTQNKLSSTYYAGNPRFRHSTLFTIPEYYNDESNPVTGIVIRILVNAEQILSLDDSEIITVDCDCEINIYDADNNITLQNKLNLDQLTLKVANLCQGPFVNVYERVVPTTGLNTNGLQSMCAIDDTKFCLGWCALNDTNNTGIGRLEIIDFSTGEVIKNKTATIYHANSMTYCKKTNLIYVVGMHGNEIHIINASSLNISRNVVLPKYYNGICYNNDADCFYLISNTYIDTYDLSLGKLLHSEPYNKYNNGSLQDAEYYNGCIISTIASDSPGLHGEHDTCISFFQIYNIYTKEFRIVPIPQIIDNITVGEIEGICILPNGSLLFNCTRGCDKYGGYRIVNVYGTNLFSQYYTSLSRNYNNDIYYINYSAVNSTGVGTMNNPFTSIIQFFFREGIYNKTAVIVNINDTNKYSSVNFNGTIILAMNKETNNNFPEIMFERSHIYMVLGNSTYSNLWNNTITLRRGTVLHSDYCSINSLLCYGSRASLSNTTINTLLYVTEGSLVGTFQCTIQTARCRFSSLILIDESTTITEKIQQVYTNTSLGYNSEPNTEDSGS